MSHHDYPYDKHLEHQDQTTLGKLQQQYWTTKQQVIKKLGKKEDEHVVASDCDLDAKLELFAAIKQSSIDLLRVIELYQEKLCQLSMEEAEMSQFLKEFSSYDKTRAGKMMSAVSKAQNFSSQQRMTLRVPLARLYNEVETFKYRAVTDTLITVRKMENKRTEYRGALLWMKNISEELDPDTHKKLEKFRRVQAQVKITKTKFDQYKMDVIQKIDLLSASRCNMFSHVLVNYQQSLINFWEKTSKAMNTIAEAFKGYQYYEFNIIKDLNEPSKRLAALVNKESTSSGDVASAKAENDTDQSTNTLIDFDTSKSEENNDSNADKVNELIDLMASKEEININEQLKEFELLEKLKFDDKNNKNSNNTSHNTSNDFEELTSNSLFKNIIQQADDDFEKEWQSVFSSSTTSITNTNLNQNLFNKTQTNNEQQQQQENPLSPDLLSFDATNPLSNQFNFSQYLPSQLLNINKITQQNILKSQADNKAKPIPNALPTNASSKTPNTRDMSSWYNLFADLDPLQNPDAIGTKDLLEEERNC